MSSFEEKVCWPLTYAIGLRGLPLIIGSKESWMN
jgi:hypothetical protein